MNRLTYFLCVSLSLTSIAFFSIGFAEFTLFHGLFVIYAAYLVLTAALNNKVSLKIPSTLIALGIYITMSNLVFAESFKVTSLIYSIVIIIELIVLAKISRGLEMDDIRKIAKGVIFLFFISIAIESLFILVHIKPPGILADLFPIYDYAGQIRPMGLSNEPSYAAITLVFALFVLMRCDQFTFNVKEAYWYLLAVLAIFLSGSTYGYALSALLLAYFVIVGRITGVVLRFLVRNPPVAFLVLAALAAVIVMVALNLDNKSFQRLVSIYDIFNQTGFNISALLDIAYVDSSAGMRIVPSLQLIEYFSNTDTSVIFFGKGAGQATLFYSELWGQLTQVGFIPAFIYNYGLIGFFVCLFCLRPLFPTKGWLLVTIYFLFLFNADFNTQLFVYVLFTVMLCAQIEKLEWRAVETQVTA
jgi:hypothetical protein